MTTTVICPRCDASSKTNKFKDASKKFTDDHPYITSKGFTVCLPSYKGALRLELADKGYESIRIDFGTPLVEVFKDA